MSIKKCAADIFHKQYGELSQEKKDLIKQIKEEAEQLYSSMNFHFMNNEYGRRELALAFTCLEESVMWAVKGITKN